jgi:diguanylate cyclase (GGDEF)-like protein/PAS domain S-box-containing protein
MRCINDSASSQTQPDAPEDHPDNLPSEKPHPKDVRNKRQQIEAKLIASEARYRRLFETAKDGILILDADTGQIIDANPFLQDLLGYTHAELLGKTLWGIGPFRDVAASQSAFQLLQTNEYVRYENLPLESKTGQHRQVEFVSNIYLVDKQRVIQCNIRDITARKQTEAEVRKANEELVALVAKLKKRDQEMQLLNRMNDLLQACTTKAEAFEVITLIGGEMFSDRKGSLAISHPWDQHFEVVARWGSEVPVEAIFSWEDCWAMRRGQLHEVANPEAGLLCRHFVHPPETGYLCLPLMVHGETLGSLCLLGGEMNGTHFADQQLAVAMGEGIKLALSNIELREELREQAIHDPLTGLYNRRYLEDSLARELYVAQRRNTPLCVVMLDIDHFKQINDAFGHAAGDAQLREMGRILHEHLRMSDIACRYGGDEFVLILPDSPLGDTRQRVQQILELVKEARIWHADQLLESLTVSAGVADAEEHNFIGSEILRAADDALYAAKQVECDPIVTNPGED